MASRLKAPLWRLVGTVCLLPLSTTAPPAAAQIDGTMTVAPPMNMGSARYGDQYWHTFRFLSPQRLTAAPVVVAIEGLPDYAPSEQPSLEALPSFFYGNGIAGAQLLAAPPLRSMAKLRGLLPHASPRWIEADIWSNVWKGRKPDISIMTSISLGLRKWRMIGRNASSSSSPVCKKTRRNRHATGRLTVSNLVFDCPVEQEHLIGVAIGG